MTASLGNPEEKVRPRTGDPWALGSGIETVSRVCPLCGSGDDTRVFSEVCFDPAKLDRFAFVSCNLPGSAHDRLVECPTCDLLYACPVPTVDSPASLPCVAGFDSGEKSHRPAVTYAGFLVGHLQLFIPRSMRALFEQAGFHGVEVRRVSNRYPIQYRAKLFPIPKALKGPALAALRRTRLGRLPASLPVGNLAVIGPERGAAAGPAAGGDSP